MQAIPIDFEFTKMLTIPIAKKVFKNNNLQAIPIFLHLLDC